MYSYKFLINCFHKSLMFIFCRERIVLNKTICSIINQLRTSISFFKGNNLCMRKTFYKTKCVFNRCSLKSEDRLVWVSYNKKICLHSPVMSEKFNNGVLRRICILIFINQKI